MKKKDQQPFSSTRAGKLRVIVFYKGDPNSVGMVRVGVDVPANEPSIIVAYEAKDDVQWTGK